MLSSTGYEMPRPEGPARHVKIQGVLDDDESEVLVDVHENERPQVSAKETQGILSDDSNDMHLNDGRAPLGLLAAPTGSSRWPQERQ